MQLIICNTSFERIGMIETASVLWHSCYYEVGDFEIYIEALPENIELLQEKYYVVRDDDCYVGIIEDILTSGDVENGDFLTVTGKFCESILSRRIVYYQTQLNGTVENGLYTIIKDNVTNPDDKDRKIDVIELGAMKGFSERLDNQYTGDEIVEVVKGACLANSIGFKMPLINNKFRFELYKGVDHSYNQTKNSYVVFSDEFDNLVSSEYTLSTSKTKNFAVVAGEGEGTARRTRAVGNTKGLDRKELFVDARDLSSNDGEITDDEYNKSLDERGGEKLAEVKPIVKFEGEVLLDGNYVYKQDFNLGDVVTVENKKYGVFINTRIIEILESEDENGYVITPTFGE